MITLLTTFGVVMLVVAAKAMSKDNSFAFLSPVVADPPRRHPQPHHEHHREKEQT